MLTKEPEMLQPGAFCELGMQQNATVAKALGSFSAYSALPDSLAGFKGAAFLWGEEKEGKGGEGMGRGAKRKGNGKWGKLDQGRRLATIGPGQSTE